MRAFQKKILPEWNCEEQIAASPEGQQFLRYWDTITTLMAVYSVARVAKEIPNVYRRLKELYVNLKKSKSLKPQTEKMLDNKMDETPSSPAKKDLPPVSLLFTSIS